jgi:putative addiction module antidote
MKTRLRKVGNSTGIVLPKELLSKLQLKRGDWLFVTELSDRCLMLAPRDPSLDTGLDIARKAMRKYQTALRKLAE